ncbi:MAG: HAD family hydrolase [Muribaculaceae bacterium]|nr:HAD family hydrolase [Muribaculaceae bacterium]
MAETGISASSELVVVFDLDDTLYDEVDFVLSGIEAILLLLGNIEGVDTDECRRVMYEAVNRHENHYSALESYLDHNGIRSQVNMEYIVTALRNHYPCHIELRPGMRQTLENLYKHGVILGLLTDGRSVTQRHKIESLGIGHYFDSEAIRISGETGVDKHKAAAYSWFMEHYPDRRYVYIGDNPAKDFLYPNRMGWLTICIADPGRNIHPQQNSDTAEARAQLTVTAADSLAECVYKNATITGR